jgi:NADP-dependent 3-hydroxy acid dehydrogenase YdfG
MLRLQLVACYPLAAAFGANSVSVQAAVDGVAETFDGVDIVVNNAGVGQPEPIDDLSIEAYRTLNGVNIDGVYFVTRAALSYLRESSGNLIFLGSTAGLYHEPGHPLYAATKWWTRGFAANLAGTVGEDGIGVTVVHPTAVRTAFGSAFREPNRDRYDPGTVLEPEDVAEAILFAATRSPPQTVNELELVRRNEFSGVDRF